MFKLDESLTGDIGANFNKCLPEQVDLSELKKYETDFNTLERIDAINFEKLSLETLRAMDLAVNYGYVAKRFGDYAHIQMDRVAATVYYNEAGSYLQKAGMRDGDGARQKFVDQHELYNQVKNIRDAWRALSDYCFQKKEIFLQKHMLVKKRLDYEMNALQYSGNKA